MKQHKSIKLEQDLIDKIIFRANKENRSFNNMVEFILNDSLRKCEHSFAAILYEKDGVRSLDNYETRCILCGERPSPVTQTFHGGQVQIS